MTEIEAEPLFNQSDDSLPYGYFKPELEGKLTWVCGEDESGKITSVFRMDLGDGQIDKKCDYVSTIEDAKTIRQELINDGWAKLVPPRVTFTFPGEKESRTLNRGQKRYLARQIKKMATKNPFDSNSLPSNDSSDENGKDEI